MDYKDPKNQILILVVIVFFGLIYLWYAKFYSPYSVQLSSDQARLEKILKNLHEVQQKAASLDALQQEYASLERRYGSAKMLLPEQKEDETLLSQIHIAAQQTNSAIVGITPMPSTPKDFYIANTYLIEISSTYNSLGEFFAKVANFPFIITISDVQMTATDPTQGAALKSLRRKDHTLTATFKLTTYNVREVNVAVGGQAK